MAISINPLTFVIYVPKADLTLVQASPEVRELDVNDFRLALKNLEDDPDHGIFLLKTHSHNTEVTLSGLTYARIVEILDPYTVEFEDGQYTINCVGANHNLADVKVANQVSLIVNNAAGLINNAQIEYGSFGGGVTVDEVNGTTGTVFPRGTPQLPVNNWSDALLIASVRGFTTFYVVGDSTVDGSNNFNNMVIIGESPNKSEVSIQSLSTTVGLELKNATITGTLDGDNFISDSILEDLSYFNGEVVSCGLIGDIVLGGTADVAMVDCFTVDQDNPPVIDMGGSGCSLAMPNYAGLLTIKNLNDADQEVGVGFNAGMAILDSTILAGTIIISGIGGVMDSSGGTASVDVSSLISNDSLANAVWSHADAEFTLKVIKNKKSLEKSGSIWQLIVYDDDDSTPILTKDLKDTSGNNITDLSAGVLAQELATSV